MNHLSALLNVMESIEIDKEMGIEIFEKYLSEFLQLTFNDKTPIKDEDLDVMKEIAFALGLSEKEFEKIFDMEENENEEEYDKYDAQVDNKDLPPGSNEFTSYLNRWVSPNSSDSNYLF